MQLNLNLPVAIAHFALCAARRHLQWNTNFNIQISVMTSVTAEKNPGMLNLMPVSAPNRSFTA